jgi:hypothetical protein
MLFRNLEDKTDRVARDFNDLQKQKISEINQIEDYLAKELPSAHLTIQSACAEVEQRLEDFHTKVRDETNTFKEGIEEEREEREKVFKKVAGMVASTVEEIKRDLELERRTREQTKCRLLSLFASASAKLGGHQ